MRRSTPERHPLLRGNAAIVPMVWLLDPRNGDAFDLPPTEAPPANWVMASVPRSGSTLLCRVLWDTGRVGAPKEYMNPMQLRDWEARLGATPLRRFTYGLLFGRAAGLARGTGWSKERLAAHLNRVRARRSDASGRFGLKIHYHHLERWFFQRRWSIDELLAPQSWVRIVREDRVAQAVSWARALQSGRWAAHQRATLPSFYRARQIDRLLAEVDRQEAGWDALFEQRDQQPLRVTYEELVDDIPGTVRRVLAHLGVPDAATVRVAEPDLRRLSDDTSARWIARYRAAVGD